MAFFDWLRKNVKNDTVDIVVEQTQSVDDEKEIIISSAPVIVSKSDYNPLDVISVFQYAIKKYGNSICSNPTRLRNIMADLGPNIANESKILIALSAKNDLLPLVETASMASADARILFERMLTYLIKEEYIDKQIAYLFLNKLFDSLIGKKIIIDALEKEDTSKEKASSQFVERSTQEEDFITKATIEQLKQRLIDEENARKKAEELVEAERIQRQLLEERLKEEYEKRKQVAYVSNHSMHQEDSDNSDKNLVSEDKQREELLRRLVCILNSVDIQEENEQDIAIAGRKSAVNIQRSHRQQKIWEDDNNSQGIMNLENQRAMLVGTLKTPMQRFVNVLHEIAEKSGPPNFETRNTTNVSNYYQSTSSYFSSSYSPSSYSYASLGRTEYVNGHWRRRNGELEYVRPHTRRK